MKNLLITACITVMVAGCGGGSEKVTKKYADGKTSEEYSLTADSLLDGAYKSFHRNGKAFEEMVYDNGRLMELKLISDEEGKELAKATIKGGKGYYPHYSPKGVLVAKTAYTGGLPNGVTEVYDREGKQVAYTLNYRRGVLVAGNHPLLRAEIASGGVDSSGNETLPEGPEIAGFTVELPNSVMSHVVAGNYEAIHKMGMKDKMDAFSADIIKTYMEFALKYMGKLKQYRIHQYGTRMLQDGKELIQVSYLTEHTNISGTAAMSFLREDSSSFALVTISVNPREGQVIPALSNVADNEVKLLKEKKAAELYDKGSKLMKSIPRAQFVASMQQMFQAGVFDDMKLVMTDFTYIDDRPAVGIVYQLTLGDRSMPMTLVYFEEDDKLTFGGISL